MFIWLAALPTEAYKLHEIYIPEIDAWGMPRLSERESKNSLSGNTLRELYKLYNTPDFSSQKEDVFERNDLEGVIVLCALWAYVVPAHERVSLRNEIIEKTLKINLEEVSSVDELLNSEPFTKSSKLDPRLNLFLGILLSNKFGLPLPAIGGDVEVHSLEAKASLALRMYLLGVEAGDLAGSSCFGDAFHAFFLLSKSQHAKDRARLFLWIEACECGNFSLLQRNVEEVEEIAARLGCSDPGVRLARALLKKDSNEFEKEVSSLSTSFFPPSYPFMEKICRKNGQLVDALYFRYLTIRSPWKLNEFIEASPTKGVIKNLLIPQSERFFYDLIRTKSYDEAHSFGVYIMALLSRTSGIPKAEIPFYERISKDLIFIGREVFVKDILVASERIGLERYINREFELRYAKSLCGK